ncbi:MULTISPECIES: thiolase family protein [unclassified Rhodococcus (in: high G+C Gram-positive bacteria)]|uniref:thiolase family protein n=1 Tax=unclassified Rhodococcus (in: high G+C Gram-positive bacteria) TaxID=192944 RepID=UPI0006F41852|nr:MULTISPECIES: thiolase family protein [unclassified Rhodococcus (in: high G+C Gram-positive bacteria)]KQU38383.1 sterol carrier protein [Rhodococcus sp. Leaf225]KQU39746.1 sterol carrier protein [Rhodococcus sp. Leaf258]
MRLPAGEGSYGTIVGLGMTDNTVDGRSAADFATEAVHLALDDAGLTLDDVDGLVTSSGKSGGVDVKLASRLGLRDLGLLTQISQAGSTANAQIQLAALAIAGGLATTVVCVHADAPLTASKRARDAYRPSAGAVGTGFRGLSTVAGPRNPNGGYALAARRHMNRYGTTSEQLGAIAVGQRAWAASNPRARFQEPITVADHQASRWVVEPLHLLDCCMVSNGGVAVVVTTEERARDLAQPPVHVRGWAQSHPGYLMERGSDWGLTTGAAAAGPAALKMAGMTPADIDVRQIYDCYTYTVLVTLEDYGFCDKGEGGALAASGALAPGGALPTNTGGGQLSSFYLWGMTPLSEAIIQIRGQGGARQVPRHETAIVSGNGGILDHHSTLVLGAQSR